MSLVPMKTYLDQEMAETISRMAASQGRSESAVIAEAIRARLAADSEDVVKAQSETTKRQLNRIEARLDKIIWEQAQTKAALLLFIHVWLKHSPPLDAEIEESASMSAEARFARFIEALANELTAPGAADDLSERLADLIPGSEALNGETAS